MDTLRATNASFGALPTPCFKQGKSGKRGCTARDERPYWVADWGLVVGLVLSRPGSSTRCLASPRPLLLQN